MRAFETTAVTLYLQYDVRSTTMKKDELIHLHSLLTQIRVYFEENGDADDAFEAYDSLGIGPEHVHKSKAEHRHAVFVLGNLLAEAMGETDELSERGRVKRRMEELADGTV